MSVKSMGNGVKYASCALGALFVAGGFFVVAPVLLPCFTGFIIAYLLNPLVNRLEGIGLPRTLSSLMIMLFSAGILVALAVVFVPVAYYQAVGIVKLFVHKIHFISGKSINDILQAYGMLDYDRITESIGADTRADVLLSDKNVAFFNVFDALYRNFGKLIANVVSSGVSVGSATFKVFITLILSFYMLCNWPLIIKNVALLVPCRYSEHFLRCALRVDNIVSSYLIGQLGVCVVMAFYYCIALSVVGLKYSLVMGVLSGLMTFVPYLGPVSCFIVSLGIDVLQSFSWTSALVLTLVFVIGQLVESNVITPVLISRRLDMNPGWIVIGMLVFSTHIGFLGALLSIPITAVVSVVIRFVVDTYMHSRLYTDQ